MSNKVNDLLYERAKDMIDYWTGTTWEKIIRADIEAHDLESLFNHVAEAEAEASIKEFHADDAL